MANSSKSLVYVCVYAYNIVNCQAIFNGRNRCDVIKNHTELNDFAMQYVHIKKHICKCKYI